MRSMLGYSSSIQLAFVFIDRLVITGQTRPKSFHEQIQRQGSFDRQCRHNVGVCFKHVQGAQRAPRKIRGRSRDSPGLEILAFPCNQFAAQEPLRTEYLQETVSSRFGPHFPLFERVDVNGPNTAVLFRYLKDKSDGDRIRWNFTKFLINRTGGIAGRYAPHIPPYKLEEDIKSLLAVELPFEEEKRKNAPEEEEQEEEP
ncbi:probable phospholipid hydroperoxide glutathione peroxidase isoform X2 [Selaginella moellendorffii]|uniref:probable phospholipid hydroperoxide glutathione peroxidase isoform X2 n=1 Tax=Selaginella moellendorffii TaxID=88036 RepID=UPI000D1CFE42|nr:probable phospholipid hydroperoxide glutathione peroxidase isoform X2 [Selaginella moellendorffii]|eukprot:XP_024545021.1 probable phospholipid hydroperoxide glutathione peroxidase isoform X2 [Selaginella moellendorffii]